MILEPTENKELIKELLLNVWNDIKADGDELINFDPVIDKSNIWVIVRDYDIIVGIANIKQNSSISVELHPYLLSGKGKGREFVKFLLKEIVKAGFLKVLVSIPTLYKIAINTAKKIGFISEGKERLCFLNISGTLTKLSSTILPSSCRASCLIL